MSEWGKPHGLIQWIHFILFNMSASLPILVIFLFLNWIFAVIQLIIFVIGLYYFKKWYEPELKITDLKIKFRL